MKTLESGMTAMDRRSFATTIVGAICAAAIEITGVVPDCRLPELWRIKLQAAVAPKALNVSYSIGFKHFPASNSSPSSSAASPASRPQT